MLKKILVIAGALFIVACSSGSRQYAAYIKKNNSQSTTIINGVKTNKPYLDNVMMAKGASHELRKLNNVYNQWAGTRYRLGGTTRSGIDCSAFMQETFAAVFGVALPRTTSEQQSLGYRINKHELKHGDLVFFRSNRHVGVYIGNGQFMHASSSQGVTISSLDQNYWARTYTQSRRVL